ncbi:uncharacterized protein LOC122311763 [Carya illinoinensis]|uniref:Uncharacterized protein n=1 Tax=Carya illinoinensis TaxID=32201 RepID=A0A8T1QDX5_CARIL|nr:uncharacterized protein LOC122311763 [Carya illinoinensis]KAG6652607.1 hypothetical protein CIPAW_05G017800 [Carya illinoinensis]
MALTGKIPSSMSPPPNHLRIRTRTQIASPSIISLSRISPFQATSKAHLNSPRKSTTRYENREDKIEATLPTMSEILESSRAQNLDLQLQTLGPFFRITAKSLETQKELGKAGGLTRVWLQGRILHLDSIRLRRDTLGMEKSIFGIGLFIGAVAVRYGYDCGCTTAELLAINDSDLYHSKLVRFYTRIGFKAVHEVTGSTFRDYAHMLVWGGIGTRMDANVEELLIRWCTRFKSRK